MFIGAKLNQDPKNRVITLLHAFKHVLAWCYEDIPDLNTETVVHRFAVTTRIQALKTEAKNNEACMKHED